MAAVMVRLPFAPLADLVARMEADREPCGDNAVAIARVLGRSRYQVYRWRREGLSERVADELATHVGWHPDSIWTDQHRVAS